jgi:hypothetical protein
MALTRRLHLALASAVATVSLGAGILIGQSMEAAEAATTFYLSPTGSDSAACTQAAPCRTLERGQAVASAGDTVRLAPGSYSSEGHTTTLSEGGITYTKGVGTAKPSIKGKTNVRGVGIVLSNLIFDGPTGDVNGNVGCSAFPGESVLIDIGASNARLVNSEIKESRGNAGIFVSNDAANVDINRNYIHDNGGFGDCGSSFENGQHGIYWSSGSGWVRNNKIVHNWTRGVQLYSRPHDVIVTQNTIVWNGRAGVIHDSHEGGGNVVANNIIAGNAWNGQGGIYYRSGGTPIVRNNVLWHNVDDLIAVSCTGCVTADPAFVGADIDNPPAPLDRFRRWTPAEAKAANLHLSASSPAIGLADPFYSTASDFELQTRDADPDAGAYEYP